MADQDEEVLIRQDNPLALAVLANLYVIQSRQEPELRMKLKRKLVEHLHLKEISLQKFNQILNFALHFVRLPEEDEVDFQNYFFKKYVKEDMTGREKALAYGQKLSDNFALFLERKLAEERQAREKEYERIRGEERQAREKEYERIRAEERQAYERDLHAREAVELKKNVFNLHQKIGLTPEQIAATLEIELVTVLKILEVK